MAMHRSECELAYLGKYRAGLCDMVGRVVEPAWRNKETEDCRNPEALVRVLGSTISENPQMHLRTQKSSQQRLGL